MRKFFAAAMGSVVALAGFASTANASATIDLIWIDVSNTTSTGAIICLRPAKRDCPQIGTEIKSVASSDDITLLVQVTAGPDGVVGAAVSVDFTELVGSGTPDMSVQDFQSMSTFQPGAYFVQELGVTSVIGTFVDNVNASSSPFLGVGLGLPATATAYLGTVTFHETNLVNGTFVVDVGLDGPGGTDGVGNNLDPPTPIGDSVTFNSARVVNVPEPGALSLLVMGLGGMLLAGRGRK
jgi:hypothetical protein